MSHFFLSKTFFPIFVTLKDYDKNDTQPTMKTKPRIFFLFLILFCHASASFCQDSLPTVRLSDDFIDSINLKTYTSIFVDSILKTPFYTIENQEFTPLSKFSFGGDYERGRYKYWFKTKAQLWFQVAAYLCEKNRWYYR
jgi:hypothetical protein